MTKEENKTDGDINIHGLADHQALRKMGTERLKELLNLISIDDHFFSEFAEIIGKSQDA